MTAMLYTAAALIIFDVGFIIGACWAGLRR